MTLADRTWQDREIRFDISILNLKPIDGETIICRRSRVEDSKGNTSISGVLMVTNLRIIWHSEKNTRTNISIGNGCVKVVTSSTAERKNRNTALGINEVLYIVSKCGEAKFEFIFSSQDQTATEIYQIAQETMSMYSRTSILRQVRLRSSSIFTDSLVLAPHEEIISFIEGAWNVTAEQGTLGTFYLTRRRAVWIALCNSVYNASIPYMHVQRAELRVSKVHGTMIVLETSEISGALILGFKIDSEKKLGEISKEINFQISELERKPFFGFEGMNDHLSPNNDAQINASNEEDEISTGDVQGTDGNTIQIDKLVFHEPLGLCFELADYTSIERAWDEAVKYKVN